MLSGSDVLVASDVSVLGVLLQPTWLALADLLGICHAAATIMATNRSTAALTFKSGEGIIGDYIGSND